MLKAAEHLRSLVIFAISWSIIYNIFYFRQIDVNILQYFSPDDYLRIFVSSLLPAAFFISIGLFTGARDAIADNRTERKFIEEGKDPPVFPGDVLGKILAFISMPLFLLFNIYSLLPILLLVFPKITDWFFKPLENEFDNKKIQALRLLLIFILFAIS